MIKRIRGGIKEKNYKIKNIFMREKRRNYMLKRGGKSNEKNQ